MMTRTIRLFLALAAVTAALGSSAVRAQEATALALPERRAVKQYQDTKFVEEQKAVRDAAGFDLPVEVKWEAIARPGEAASFTLDTYWTDIYFKPLTAALKQITADQMGAEALKGKLKKIVVTYDKATAPVSDYAKGLTFDGGTLTINFEPNTNAGDVEARTKAMVGVLSAKL